MLAEHRHLKCLTELIEFSRGILFECSWHHLPLRFLSVILKFIGQKALEETILAPSFMLANLNFNWRWRDKLKYENVFTSSQRNKDMQIEWSSFYYTKFFSHLPDLACLYESILFYSLNYHNLLECFSYVIKHLKHTWIYQVHVMYEELLIKCL